jgi:hypothetical protein
MVATFGSPLKATFTHKQYGTVTAWVVAVVLPGSGGVSYIVLGAGSDRRIVGKTFLVPATDLTIAV